MATKECLQSRGLQIQPGKAPFGLTAERALVITARLIVPEAQAAGVGGGSGTEITAAETRVARLPVECNGNRVDVLVCIDPDRLGLVAQSLAFAGGAQEKIARTAANQGVTQRGINHLRGTAHTQRLVLATQFVADPTPTHTHTQAPCTDRRFVRQPAQALASVG